MDTNAEDLLDIESEAEILTSDAAAETETTPLDYVEKSFRGKHVFISHKCDVEQDENIAWNLYNDLKALGCDVYLDKAQPIGVPFDDEIKKSLKRADFFVALLTSAANESDWVNYELVYARDQLRQRGSPIILPIKLGSFELSMSVGASVSRLNRRSYDPRDYNKILADVKAGILNESSLPDITPIGMEGFVISEFRRNLTRAATVPSNQLRQAVEALHKDKLFWIRGDDSVRNHFAHCLAVAECVGETVGAQEQKRAPNIYEIPATRNWSRVDATLVRDSIIIFRDVLPSVVSNRESTGVELDSLKNLVGRNLVIITAADDAYTKIEQEMRDRGIPPGTQIVVNHDFYDEQTKLTIFERLLDFSSKFGDITPAQLKWASRLAADPEELKTLRPILKKWSPADIERFVMQHLRRAKRQGDVLKLLQRNAQLDDEIHGWFMALDDSTRCFVLALSMLRGLRKEQFWQKYKLIVQHLKKLDSNLSLSPLGICCKRAEPYVAGEDQIDFTDERIREAIDGEVTKNFREYLIELVPLIMELSVPSGRDQKMTRETFETRKPQVAATRDLRVALARITGKAIRRGLAGFNPLLEFWATDPVFSVREAVAISVRMAVTDQPGARQCLAMLQEWCNDRSAGAEVLYRSWAAASALAAIIAARPERGTYERALDLLERLASRVAPGVKLYLSISLKRAAGRVPLKDREAPVTLESVLKLVSQDEKAATKINVAEALCEARLADEVSAMSVIQDWIVGSDLNCRWAGICSILLWRKQKREEWTTHVVRFLKDDAQTTASVLVEILVNRDQNAFLERIGQFWLKADPSTRVALVSALASVPPARLNEKILPTLRASEIPALNDLAFEIRCSALRELFNKPAALRSAITAYPDNSSVQGEIISALESLMREEPQGHREELLNILARAQSDDALSMRMLLRQFRSMNVAALSEFVYAFNFRFLTRELADPERFVTQVCHEMSDPDVRDEVLDILWSLSMPEPDGQHGTVVRALGLARLNRPAEVNKLLEDSSWQHRSGLFSLATEVKLFSFLSYLVSPRLASGILRLDG